MTQEEANVTLKVNSQEAKAEFEALEKKAEKLRTKFAEAFRRGDTRAITDINHELGKVNSQMNRMRLNAANIRAAMVRISEATPKELQRTIKQINEELSSGRVKRGSQEWNYYNNKLKEVRAELAKVQAESQETEGLLSKINRKINDWGGTLAAGAAALAGVVMSGKAAVQSYAEMQQEEANVRKFTGMTEQQVKALNDEFKKIDTRTSRQELNKLAQEAGRLGKTSQEDVLGFVKAANQINVALDDLGEGATLTLSKLTNIFGDEEKLGTERALLAVGSVINELSQNCTASAPYIAEFSKRLAGVGEQAKMTVPQIMSVAAVLDSQGQNCEAAATAISQLIMSLYQEPAKIAKAAGMDVKKFTEVLKKDANEALIMLLQTLKSYGGIESLATILEDMGADGARASAVISALANSVDMLVWEQGEANKAFQEATSVTKEYEVQNTTVEAKLEKARKKFTEMAVTLGEKLVPVTSHCISGTSMLLRVINVLVDFISDHYKEIITVTGAIVAYNVVLKASIILHKANTASIVALNAVEKTFLATQQLLTAAIALMSGNVSKATIAWRLFNTTMKANPIALVVSLVATAVTALGSWIVENRKAAAEEKRIAMERKKRMSEFKKNLTDLSSLTAQLSSKEISKLKSLYKTATNANKSYKEREKAVKALQATYPNTFKNFTTEDFMLGKVADSYLKLAKNIKELARVEAARAKMKSNEETKLSLELDNDNIADEIAEKEAAIERIEKRIGKVRTAVGGNYDNAKELRTLNAARDELYKQLEELDLKRAENTDKISEAFKANEKLAKITEQGIKALEDFKLPESPEFSGVKPESEKERKAREKEEREAKKKQREAEREAKKLLDSQLDSVKAARHQEEAANLAAYTTGLKNYLEYVEAKAEIDRKYIDDSLKVLEDNGKKETDAYAKLLLQREEIEKSVADNRQDASLIDVEDKHKKNEDNLMSQFFDPDSSIFQNVKALNQLLLEEDVRYLQEKLSLYSEGSKEWINIFRQINERVSADKLAKQEETADAYQQFVEQYRHDYSSQVEAEIDILEVLHEQGIISEQEYQDAIYRIKKKYRDKEQEERMELHNEYTDLLVDVYKQFKEFFDNIGKGGKNLWKDLSKTAESAVAITGAFVSQYTSYTNAQRDAELAKIESRYDKEIEAAGNNKKKRETLEKQKEEEMSRTRRKYAKKTQNIQVAQAVAETASAAISAYVAALQVGGMAGLILAPIAAAMATAFGMMQVATIKKQHQAESSGYYSGGFTRRDPDNHKEVGTVHANEFVMNHKAVANPALSPVLNLIDKAQRSNTVGSLTAEDVSNVLGLTRGVGAGGVTAPTSQVSEAMTASISSLTVLTERNREAIDRLSRQIDEGIETYIVMDGEKGLFKQIKRHEKIINNPKR